MEGKEDKTRGMQSFKIKQTRGGIYLLSNHLERGLKNQDRVRTRVGL